MVLKYPERKKLTEQEPDLVENVNRITIEGDVARNVDEAISILTLVYLIIGF